MSRDSKKIARRLAPKPRKSVGEANDRAFLGRRAGIPRRARVDRALPPAFARVESHPPRVSRRASCVSRRRCQSGWVALTCTRAATSSAGSPPRSRRRRVARTTSTRVSSRVAGSRRSRAIPRRALPARSPSSSARPAGANAPRADPPCSQRGRTASSPTRWTPATPASPRTGARRARTSDDAPRNRPARADPRSSAVRAPTPPSPRRSRRRRDTSPTTKTTTVSPRRRDTRTSASTVRTRAAAPPRTPPTVSSPRPSRPRPTIPATPAPRLAFPPPAAGRDRAAAAGPASRGGFDEADSATSRRHAKWSRCWTRASSGRNTPNASSPSPCTTTTNAYGATKKIPRRETKPTTRTRTRTRTRPTPGLRWRRRSRLSFQARGTIANRATTRRRPAE